MGDLAVVDDSTTTAALHLAAIGQHVSFLPDAERTPELTEEERSGTFVVRSIEGEFVRLARLDGTEFGWFKSDSQLAPARAVEENNIMQDNTTTDIERKAAQFSARVTALSTGRPLRDAISLAAAQDAEGAEAYRLVGIGATQVDEAPAPISLSAHAGEPFDALAQRYAIERGISLRQAVHEVGRLRPDLVAARGEYVQFR